MRVKIATKVVVAQTAEPKHPCAGWRFPTIVRIMHDILLKSIAFPAAVFLSLLMVGFAEAADAQRFLSHPPLRDLPKPVDRPLGTGPAHFVDATKGDDSAPGTEAAPWKTVTQALTQIKPGGTLYLRGGTYYEHVYCSAAGTEPDPITIRSYPGELVVIDGGLREFFDSPSAAWEPYAEGAAGEYRSTKPYRNLRNLHGRFGDSMIGLQIYYYVEDLRGERYVGPGLWYDRLTGHIHARLQHYDAFDGNWGKEGIKRARGEVSLTHLPSRVQRYEQYQGETDPRKLPLIVAPFRSVPLFIDRAEHVRFQDLVVRGGAYDVVDIRHGIHIEFDNVVIYAGAYGLRARNTGPFRFHNSAIYGSVPPWSMRRETSLKERPWRSKTRNLTRLNTHALLIPASGDEYSVYYFPYNHRWEISYSEFTDAHDGVYLGDIDGLKFHHNFVDNFQDDGIYLSCFRKVYYPQHGPRQIYQNLVSGCIMSFAYGGDARLGTDVHIFRNVLEGAAFVSDHGGPPWDGMRVYQNTILANPKNLFNLRHTKPGQTWQVFNNIVLSGPDRVAKEQEGAASGGNFSGDPKFVAPGEFQLQADSPAVDAGQALPADWPDPLRNQEQGKPDAGAIPLGSGPLQVGRFGRHAF